MTGNIIPFYRPLGKWVVKSCDCYLYDQDGKEYIDFESGVWCANLGHGHERITRLIASQAAENLHHGYAFGNPHAEALSSELQRLAGITGGSSVFLSSGSEAVNLAITLARHVTGRKKILRIDNSYLSAYGYGMHSADNSAAVSVPYNDTGSVDSIDFPEISAFVIETGGASFGVVRFPGKEFVERLVRGCRDNGCLVIADEVTTGMGRMGEWFGYRHYGLSPDMVVCGKGLGNGYPVSAVVANREVCDLFEKDPFRYAQSHQNDPLGCAVGLEVIRTIEQENLITLCRNTGKYFHEQLDLLRKKHPGKVTEVRSRGLMLALELNPRLDGQSIHNRMFEEGLVTGFKANTFRFLPPFTIKTTDIDRLAAALDSLLMLA